MCASEAYRCTSCNKKTAVSSDDKSLKPPAQCLLCKLASSYLKAMMDRGKKTFAVVRESSVRRCVVIPPKICAAARDVPTAKSDP